MQPNANPLLNMVPIAAIFVIFYFLLIRPQQKQQSDHEKMLKGLQKGDKILTTGGLYGTIVDFVGPDGQDLLVQFSQTVKLTVARSAVSSLVSSNAPAKAGAAV
jgi:preprotein translocase subunit YajC